VDETQKKRGSNKQKANLNSDTSQKICRRDEAKRKTKLRQNKPKIVPRKLQKKNDRNSPKNLIREGNEGEN
jgi:hypothetical protein